MENRIQGNLWKPCGCHLERAGSGWAPRLALLPIPPSPQPQLFSPLCLSLFHDATKRVCVVGFWNTQTSCFPPSIFSDSGACARGPAHGFCMLWKAIPFPHLSYGGLQLPLAREAQILHCHKFPVHHLKPGLCRQPSPTALPLGSPSSSSCLSDLSLPAHHSSLPTQALISISLPHVLAPGDSSPNTTPRTPVLAVLSTALPICCHTRAESWYASPLQNCQSQECQEVEMVLRHKVK